MAGGRERKGSSGHKGPAPTPMKKKPAKNPPSTKDPYDRNVYGVKSRAKSVQVTGAKPGELKKSKKYRWKNEGYEWLRHSAATQYVTNIQGLSIRELHTQHPFNEISLITLERWGVEDEWVRRRQKYFEEITSEIKARIAEKRIQGKVAQLEKIDKTTNDLFRLIKRTKANSKEGVVSALVKMLQFGEDIRDKLEEAVVPERFGGVKQETIPVTPQLSADEAREAARVILQRRRAKMRLKAKEEKEEKDGKPKSKPRLRVVEGNGDE